MRIYKGKTIQQRFESFDLSTLDTFEQMQYIHLIKQSTKAEVLQILINNVEGDTTQLSRNLAYIAQLQQKMYSPEETESNVFLNL